MTRTLSKVYPAIRDLRSAVARAPKVHPRNQPEALDVSRVVLRHPPMVKGRPMSTRRFTDVAVDMNNYGRLARALVSLVADPRELTVWNVSNFDTVPMILAFADAREYRIILPERPFALRSGRFMPCDDYYALVYNTAQRTASDYYLLPFSKELHADVIFMPDMCDCCFDSATLDPLRSTMDLRGPNSALIMRLEPNWVNWLFEFGMEPFIGWMSRAGFGAHLFLGVDILGDQLSQKNPFSLSRENKFSYLFQLGGPEAKAEAVDIIAKMEKSREVYYKGEYALYLVFQRQKLPVVGEMSQIFTEALDWEARIIGDRVNPDKFMMINRKLKDTIARLESFQRGVEELVANFEAGVLPGSAG